MSAIGWGVDGFGSRHYICNYCELYFGRVDRDLIRHDCDRSKPKYHNRGVICQDAAREIKYRKHQRQNKNADSIELHCSAL